VRCRCSVSLLNSPVRHLLDSVPLFCRISASEIHTGDEPEAVHELTFPDPPEAYVFDRGVVTFWGQGGERRVQYAISREALDDHFKGDKKDKLEVFRANRRAIEEEARRKYLAGAIEPDGSVLVRTLDLAR
jgi:Protein of unknown function (DUF1488)